MTNAFGKIGNIYTDDTDINVIKTWLCGITQGATCPILYRFLPRIEYKDWQFEEIEDEVDTIIGPCLYLKVDSKELEEKAQKMLNGLNRFINDVNKDPSQYFENARKM